MGKKRPLQNNEIVPGWGLLWSWGREKKSKPKGQMSELQLKSQYLARDVGVNDDKSTGEKGRAIPGF
jgi:hypothetical protein